MEAVINSVRDTRVRIPPAAPNCNSNVEGYPGILYLNKNVYGRIFLFEVNFKYLNLTSYMAMDMKFHNVLEEVFGTQERVRVLRILARHPKEFTSRELSGYCGVSVRGVIDILTLFERHGFVKSRRVGSSILWKLDREHYLIRSIVLPNFQVEEDLPNRLSHEISKTIEKSPVKKAVIYGSTASGDERPDSDVDLLLLVAEKGKLVEELENQLRERILRLFGNMLSILVCTPRQYKRLNPGLKKRIEKGIAVLGG